MFVDRVQFKVQAGRGGDGAVSFLREAFRPRGGPDGGDGGVGGSIVLRVSTHHGTLQDLKARKHYRARPGQPGRGKTMHGRGAEDLEIHVPPGTLVYDVETEDLVVDLTEPDQTFVLARGGKGGKGNASFATALNQVPRQATSGEPGQSGEYRLELKLMAEVGLVGLPNAGKSTFLSRVTRATPRIAAYPFTTLVPHLGVADLGTGRTLVLADIPGLIEGASEGKGLGDEFLRHVERTRVLLHLVDALGEEAGGLAPEAAYRTIRRELESYPEADLASKPELVGLNKADALPEEEANARAAALERALGVPVRVLSGVSGRGCEPLLQALAEVVAEAKAQEAEAQAAEAQAAEGGAGDLLEGLE